MQTRQPDPIQTHLRTKQFREDRLWMMRNGQWVTEVDGKLVDEETFTNLYPVYNPVTFVLGRENVDRTRAWINE